MITHEKLVRAAIAWLRRYGCGVVLSEQSCASGETPDAIGWKRGCHSVIVECKISRADFSIDQEKPFRRKPEKAMGCERFYLTPAGLLRAADLPLGWGLLELRGRSVELVGASSKKQRSAAGASNSCSRGSHSYELVNPNCMTPAVRPPAASGIDQQDA